MQAPQDNRDIARVELGIATALEHMATGSDYASVEHHLRELMHLVSAMSRRATNGGTGVGVELSSHADVTPAS